MAISSIIFLGAMLCIYVTTFMENHYGSLSRPRIKGIEYGFYPIYYTVRRYLTLPYTQHRALLRAISLK